MTNGSDYPDFGDALKQFAAFAGQEHLPQRLVFVTSTDVVIRGGRVYVRIPDQGCARNEAAGRYDVAVRKDLGVLLAALCTLEDQTCVYVASPAHEDEATRLMYCRGLKLSVPAKMRPARTVGWLTWVALKLAESTAARNNKAELLK
jgi:hypothetical protein